MMWPLLLLAILPPAQPTSQPTPQTTTRPAGAGSQEVGTAIYAGDAVVWDYYPKSQLITDETLIERAKFPAIDVHCHWTLDEDPAGLLAAMEHYNLAYAVNLSGGYGDELREMLETFDDERFIIFCNLDYAGLDSEDPAAFYERQIRDAHAVGARGLKIFKDLGLTVKDAAGNRVAVDDPRLDAAWATAGELGMPVLIHVADPAAFFEPVDGNNERFMQLHRHLDWAFGSDEFLSRPEILAERDRMVAKHPRTNFIGAHVANESEDLKSVAERMRKLPNLFADISGREAELGRQPYSARKFLIEFQDRILFGTDRHPARPDQPRYRVYFRMLETDDEYFDYYEHPFPPTGEWKIYGLFLPDEVLKKVYYENAAKLLGLPTP